MHERPEHPDLHEAAVPTAAARARSQAVEPAYRVVQVARVAVGTVLGEQQPHEGELVELSEVGHVVDLQHPLVVGPVPRVGQSTLRDP